MSPRDFKRSLRAKGVPREIARSLALVDVEYRGFDAETHQGQIVVHKDAKDSIGRVFRRILHETSFPVTSVIPVSEFDWADSWSMERDNSSGFNWRLVSGTTEVSDHAFGSAVDLNPRLNPWVRGGTTNPRYVPTAPGTLSASSHVVRIFKEEGWKWGGDWKTSKDWQHFYRPEIPLKYFGKAENPE